jgi:two-component system LytT family response regulator
MVYMTDRLRSPSKPHKIRTIVVEHFQDSVMSIVELLSSIPDIDIVERISDSKLVLKTIRNLSPELVFVDIEESEIDGFGIADALDKSEMPAIIFVACTEDFARRAFDVAALDYLVKPLDQMRLEKAIGRAREFIALRTARDNSGIELRQEKGTGALKAEVRKPSSQPADSSMIERIAVKNNGHIVFVRTTDVDWFEAWGDYIRIHVNGTKHVIREKISRLETRLDPDRFVRIHRSTIVQMDRIRELQPLFHGDCQVMLNNNTILTLSRNYRNKLSHLLQNRL